MVAVDDPAVVAERIHSTQHKLVIALDHLQIRKLPNQLLLKLCDRFRITPVPKLICHRCATASAATLSVLRRPPAGVPPFGHPP